MKIFIFFFMFSFVASCSTQDQRTKFTDKTMRIMIDPNSLEIKDYVRLQAALVASKKWAVIDRSKAFEAIQKEQERLHKRQKDRFENKHKWSQWGRLYGVGGVVVGHIQCHRQGTTRYLENLCVQFLNIVDSNTGEVIAAVENEITSSISKRPNWNEIVEKLNESYPEDYEFKANSEGLYQYMDESEEAAKRAN